MSSLIIDTPERIENDIEDFKLDCVDDQKNYTATKIKLCRDPDNNKPILFYSQELTRNFRDQNDLFGKRHVIKVFTPSNLTAIVDSTLENKFNDTVLAFKNQIHDYAPLTDIHSEKMNLFMDDETATFISDVGINIDGFGDDFTEMESVESNNFLEDLSENASRLKSELFDLKKQLFNIKTAIIDSTNFNLNTKILTDEQFDTLIANTTISERLIQPYLSLKEQIKNIETKLSQVNNAVFSETRDKITLPRSLEGKVYEL